MQCFIHCSCHCLSRIGQLYHFPVGDLDVLTLQIILISTFDQYTIVDDLI